MLFELDLNPRDHDKVFQAFWEDKEVGGDMRKFTEVRVRGVRDALETIDEMIGKHAQNWDVRRMAVVDRNVMRLAVFEIMNCQDVPPAAVINEAVDLVKYFSRPESGKFVNGILDQIRKELVSDPQQ